MRSWSYRIGRKVTPIEDTQIEEYGIVEVYYNDKGDVDLYTDRFQEPWGETREELESVLKMMLEALNKPVFEIPREGEE